MRLLTGLNGVTRTVGPASELPETEEVGACEGVVVPSEVSGIEAYRLSREHVEHFVMRRYRPGGPPSIAQESLCLIHVPYRVYDSGGRWPEEALLVEGLTGARGRVKAIPGIGRALTLADISLADNKGG